MIRVVLADDSATARELLRAILEQDGDIHVVAEATDGAEAVEHVQTYGPDIVLMDVHMPVANGLEATREIMIRAPTPIVIVSSRTHRDVDLSLTATQAGALLALPKPEGPGSPGFDASARELRDMVRAMSQVKVVRRWGVASAPRPRRGRTQAADRPELIAIAASTGGPPALRRILMDLPPDLPTPVLVLQHIARDFTAVFADWLGSASALPVRLAKDGELLLPGVVYVAPDGAHLGVTSHGRVRLSHGPPVSGFRPSATHLFESAGNAYGARLVAVILTGMGADGAVGLQVARAAGAYVIAQDEASSVVYGMAQEAVNRGVVDAVIPLDDIARRLVDLVEQRSDEQ